MSRSRVQEEVHKKKKSDVRQHKAPPRYLCSRACRGGARKRSHNSSNHGLATHASRVSAGGPRASRGADGGAHAAVHCGCRRDSSSSFQFFFFLSPFFRTQLRVETSFRALPHRSSRHPAPVTCGQGSLESKTHECWAAREAKRRQALLSCLVAFVATPFACDPLDQHRLSIARHERGGAPFGPRPN